jgi:hypothetical protein
MCCYLLAACGPFALLSPATNGGGGRVRELDNRGLLLALFIVTIDLDWGN